MRRVAGVICLTVAAWLAAGGGCLPLVEFDANDSQIQPATALAVSVTAPTTSRTVPEGTLVDIRWLAVNRTGEDAIATISAILVSDRSELIIEGGIRVESNATQSIAWDTSAVSAGEYRIRVRVDAGAESKQVDSSARITIDAAPSFVFSAPTSDASLVFADPNDPNSTLKSVTIRWRAFDASGSATAVIGLDTDSDHESGNEIELTNLELPEAGETDTFEFRGTDADDEDVPSGTYRFYAIADDELNAKVIVDGAAQIIVPERPEEPEPVVLAVTQPESDLEFLASGSPIEIKYTLDEPNDVLVDLRIDQDVNHSNGNEITIKAQELVAKGTKGSTFNWNGTDKDGATVPDGIYQVVVLVNTGAIQPKSADSDGRIARRTTERRPLISMQTPSSNTAGDVGEFVSISWRDDDPDADATIRLTLDDDATPAETTETGAAEVTILTGRGASGDGVEDTFIYQVSPTLPPGTYFIFGYIQKPGSLGAPQTSTAGGRLTVKDPNNP